VRPQERRRDGLTSTPTQWPSWERRGGWGKVMISRGVEISIAGGVVAMVLGSISWSFSFSFFFFFFVIMRSLFLRYKKPYAALAMERTNPINQKQITKESDGTS